MTLLEFQREIAAGIMAPLAKRSEERRGAATLILPNDRLTALERLEIYRRSYWYRILDSLRDDFPGLCAIVGTRAFHRLSQAYLADEPSSSFTMRDLGSRLEPWLAAHPEYAVGKLDLALDMVRLEWAHIEAFDGPSVKPLGPEDLADLGPDSRFGLQPHMSLLELSYPVEDLRIRVQTVAGSDQGAASNSVLLRKERAIVHQYRKLEARPVFLAVHRIEFTVYYRPLEEGEFRILSALREGLPIGEAVERAPESAEMMETWFASWSRLGWLCAAQDQPAKKI
jgi:hypothetical protein